MTAAIFANTLLRILAANSGPLTYELREDGSTELREDGSKEVRG